jgi:CRP/FNR family transcriptional regulator
MDHEGIDFLDDHPQARAILLEHGACLSYEPGRFLWRQGAAATRVFFVLEGEVKLVREAGGREHVVHWGRPGDTLGDVPLFAEGGYPATAIATRRTRCLVADRATLELAMRADPTLAWHFLSNLGRRVRFLVQRLDERSSENVRNRLIRHIVARSDEAHSEWFRLGLTQAELAEELGTVRKVVGRTLAELRRTGVLESERGRYRIPDRDRLRESIQ